ncbi:uncharacterized protein VP01_1589g1 [Puccinia sorghi]|uniref:Uncharacterized protein n=1 Tax=Puccinia sorghi TaxID=27349 RepID=A0A0L6VHJ5_9BASI|nr:uncharacterized protein VP01_1589g1 [Puccinia sorghi]
MMILKKSCIINETGMMILKNRWLNIINKACLRAYYFTFVILGLVIVGSIFFLAEWSFVGDEPMVNAWWYLQEKYHMGQICCSEGDNDHHFFNLQSLLFLVQNFVFDQIIPHGKNLFHSKKTWMRACRFLSYD